MASAAANEITSATTKLRAVKSNAFSRDSPDDSRTGVNIRAFSGVVARLTRGVDGYQQLGQPERWSRGRSGYFRWHLDAFLLSIALERVTIKRFMLARAVAAAVAPR